MLGGDAEHQHITVKGKVVAVSCIEKINVKSSGQVLTKRDCVIADSTTNKIITRKQEL